MYNEQQEIQKNLKKENVGFKIKNSDQIKGETAKREIKNREKKEKREKIIGNINKAIRLIAEESGHGIVRAAKFSAEKLGKGYDLLKSAGNKILEKSLEKNYFRKIRIGIIDKMDLLIYKKSWKRFSRKEENELREINDQEKNKKRIENKIKKLYSIKNISEKEHHDKIAKKAEQEIVKLEKETEKLDEVLEKKRNHCRRKYTEKKDRFQSKITGILGNNIKEAADRLKPYKEKYEKLESQINSLKVRSGSYSQESIKFKKAILEFESEKAKSDSKAEKMYLNENIEKAKEILKKIEKKNDVLLGKIKNLEKRLKKVSKPLNYWKKAETYYETYWDRNRKDKGPEKKSLINQQPASTQSEEGLEEGSRFVAEVLSATKFLQNIESGLEEEPKITVESFFESYWNKYNSDIPMPAFNMAVTLKLSDSDSLNIDEIISAFMAYYREKKFENDQDSFAALIEEEEFDNRLNFIVELIKREKFYE